MRTEEKKDKKFTPASTETSGWMHEICILKTVSSTSVNTPLWSGDKSLAKMAGKFGGQNYSVNHK
jgi:hypothetical protein